MKDQSAKKRSIQTYVSEILDALGSTEDAKLMTLNLVEMATEYDVLELNNTLGEAAGLVYIAGILAGHPVTLAVIAEKVGISPETVRKFKTHLASELKIKKEWPGLPPKGK